jgi:hypothetical protein
MNPTPLVVVPALLLAVTLACSSGDDAEVEEEGRAPTTSAPSSSTSSPTTTEPVPTLRDMPEEGRNLGSCVAGQCRVTVTVGDRITVPVQLGGSTIVIAEITAGSVTLQQEGTGNPGGSTTITMQDAASGSGMLSDDETRFSLGFISIGDGEAVMQVDV